MSGLQSRQEVRMTYDRTARANFWKQRIEANPVAQAMKLATEETRRVLDGEELAVYLSGPKGIGKSHAIQAALAERKLAAVAVQPQSYRDVLDAYEQAGPKTPVFIDEADVIFQTTKNLNVLKLATDRKGARTYFPHFTTTEGPRGGEKRIRVTLSLKAPLLVATNQDLSVAPTELAEHFDALFSRQPPIIIPNDRKAIAEFAIWLGLTTHVLSSNNAGRKVSLAERATSLEWFWQNQDRLKEVSVRALENVSSWQAQYGPDNRKIDTMLSKKAAGIPLYPPSNENWQELRKALEGATTK